MQKIKEVGLNIVDYIESLLRKLSSNKYSARIWIKSSILIYQITQGEEA